MPNDQSSPKSQGPSAKIVQVGLGAWGRNWATHITPRVPKAEIVGWIDSSRPVLDAAIDELGIDQSRCFESIEEAVENIEFDGLLGTVALSAHAHVVRQAIASNKHILIEKPFAENSIEAAELAQAAKAAGIVLHVNQNYRFFPATATATRLLSQNRLGRVLCADIEFTRYAPGEGYRYFSLPDPLLVDMAVHHFDLIRMVFGCDAASVACQTWNPIGSPFLHDPAACGLIRLHDGTPVSYRGSWISRKGDTPYAGRWSIECENGLITFTSRGDRDLTINADRLTIRELGGLDEEIDLDPVPLFGRAGTLDAFARAIVGETYAPYAAVGETNVGSLCLMEAMVASAKAGGRPVDLASSEAPIPKSRVA